MPVNLRLWWKLLVLMRVQEQMCGKVHVYTGVHVCGSCVCSGKHVLVHVFFCGGQIPPTCVALQNP